MWYNWKTLVILVIQLLPIRITSYHVSSSVISHTFNGNDYVHTQFTSSKSTLSISSSIVQCKERYRSCVGLFLRSTLSIPSATVRCEERYRWGRSGVNWNHSSHPTLSRLDRISCSHTRWALVYCRIL